MKLGERLDEVKKMNPGWEHYRAMCDVFPALLEVVEAHDRDARDAARYRKLRKLNWIDWDAPTIDWDAPTIPPHDGLTEPELIDAAIDAAMGADRG